MQQIEVIENPKGTFSCPIDITQEEWKEILENPNITTSNYKKALLAFFHAPNHTSTCKALGLKYYGKAADAQKFNSWITNFGKAVTKYLNRFKIIDANGEERFWHVTMCSGTTNKEGLFETTLRPEIVSAIESLGWDRNCNYWLVGFTYDDVSQKDRFFDDGIWESRYINGKANDQKMLELAQCIRKGDIIILKSTSTKGSAHNIPFLRVIGVGIVKDDIVLTQQDTFTQCACPVHYISKDVKDFDGKVYGAYRKTIHKADSKVQSIIDYVDGLTDIKELVRTDIADTEHKYQAYIDLLEETHNLVLTGSPGTGKTYMAQAIAKEMGCTENEMAFVQFHPSYDYTDFVEGLRPVEREEGQIGFERKDGIFKEFCKRAVKNIIDSQKSVESLKKELSWEEKLQHFVDDAIENNTSFALSNGNGFTIQEMRNSSIIVHNEQNEKTTQVSVNVDNVMTLLTDEVALHNVKDIRNHFHRKNNTQADSYAFIIVKEVRKIKNETRTMVNKIERKKFVFIIDEINRGEASKIFGELFYAIDPGYRGKKDVRVKTQYQNLVAEGDVFAEGFYVPENVYILATMNDIDRSVESMDFAMRRRFTWKEITPDDTADSMFKGLQKDNAIKAKTVMDRLNKEITHTEGLGAAYQVGPSYFLKLDENGGDFEKLWKMNIMPLLKEYLRGFRKSEEIMKELKNAYFGKADLSENVEQSSNDED